MKLVLIPIAIIIAFQATTLLLGANERHIFHTTLGQLSACLDTKSDCCCFHSDEILRHVLVAFMYSASYLLLVGEAVWPAVWAQLLWVALENNVCNDRSLTNLKNLAIQALILVILVRKSRRHHNCRDKHRGSGEREMEMEMVK